MTLFAQQLNGTVRRIRGTIGGNQAWKQRDDERAYDRHARRQLIAKIDEALAFEQLDRILARKQQQQANRPKPVVVETRQSKPAPTVQAAAAVAPTSAPTKISVKTSRPSKPVKAAPRFKAVISESGKIVAVPLN